MIRYEVKSIIAHKHEEDEIHESEDIIEITLGIAIALLELVRLISSVKSFTKRKSTLSQEFMGLQPTLKVILSNSSHFRPPLLELVSSASMLILSKSGVNDKKSDTLPPKSSYYPNSLEEALKLSQEDLTSPTVPLRARGIITMNRGIDEYAQKTSDPQIISDYMKQYLLRLKDSDSYVYLAAIQVEETKIPKYLGMVGTRKARYPVGSLYDTSYEHRF